MSNATESDTLVHKSQVKVLEDKDGDGRIETDVWRSQEAQLPTASTGLNFSKVAFPTLSQAELRCTTEVHNICLSFSTAKKKRKLLRLYLLMQQKLRCDQINNSGSTCLLREPMYTMNLATLLSLWSKTNDLTKKMPINYRLSLALTLASTLLQLNSTLWLSDSWLKKMIFFPVTPTSRTVEGQLDLSHIDLSRLLMIRVFSGPQALHTSRVAAKRMILDLGIMMLELWHETTLKAYYTDLGFEVINEYFKRVKLAQIWLEEKADFILPFYSQAVARCIKCTFDNTSLNPDWESEELQNGIVKYVIEPIRAQCKFA